MTERRPPPIELRQLYVFRVVADELHFGRAAERLGIAQPPLSQQIKRLEEVIGARLFERDTRKVSLTPAGAALVEVADRLLAQLSAGIERVAQIEAGQAGRLAIGFTPTTALRILPRVVGAFRENFARVDMDLSELLPDVMREALFSSQIDVALVREPAEVDGIEIVPLTTESFVAVLPTDHPMADTAKPFALADMAHDPFVLFPRDNSSVGLAKMLAVCAEVGFVPHVVQEAPGWQTAISLVGSGLGVSILPESVVSLQLPGIVYRRIESAIRSQVSLLCRVGEERPMVRNFIASGTRIMAQ
jgi:DNA-binding transcriptional LysR family regulator